MISVFSSINVNAQPIWTQLKSNVGHNAIQSGQLLQTSI